MNSCLKSWAQRVGKGLKYEPKSESLTDQRIDQLTNQPTGMGAMDA